MQTYACHKMQDMLMNNHPASCFEEASINTPDTIITNSQRLTYQSYQTNLVPKMINVPISTAQVTLCKLVDTLIKPCL